MNSRDSKFCFAKTPAWDRPPSPQISKKSQKCKNSLKDASLHKDLNVCAYVVQYYGLAQSVAEAFCSETSQLSLFSLQMI
eukprot:4132846-Amphidinium_carterae.1